MSESDDAKKTFDVRPLEEEDFPALTRFFRDMMNVERDEAYWRWKYFANPAGGHLMPVGIDSISGEVVGQVGAIPTYMVVNGEKVLGCQVCDIIIRREYRKGGTFFKLYDLFQKMLLDRMVQLIFGFSVKETLRIGTRFLKYKVVCPIDRLVRVLNFSPFIKKSVNIPLVSSLMGRILNGAQRVVRPVPVSLPKGCRIREITEFDGRFDEFFRSPSASYNYMVCKDYQYLRWRYAECPLFNYTVLVCEKNDDLLGYTIFSIQQEDLKRAFVLELMAIEENQPKILEALLHQVIRNCLKNKVDTVASWFLEHNPAKLIHCRSGFSLKETGHNLIVRPNAEDSSTDLTEPKSWDITMGDSDYH